LTDGRSWSGSKPTIRGLTACARQTITSSAGGTLFHGDGYSLVEPGTLLGMTPPRQEKDKLAPWQTTFPAKLLDQRLGVSP
jgi:hypothetical protein